MRFFSLSAGFPALALISLLSLASCKGSHAGNGKFPDGFEQLPDAQKVAWLMQQKDVTPDSVARFICNASLGRIPGAKIDSLSIATLHAYEEYHGKDLDLFQTAYDEFTDSLPLTPKMQLLFQAAVNDPIQLGYQLGLEYVSQIRDQHKSADIVEKEIKEFKKACGSDTDTYNRFLQGFKIALEADHGKDLSEEIYRRFINY